MESTIAVFSIVLLVASFGLFIKRYLTQTPPVYPYLIIACACYASNVTAKEYGLFSIVVLTSASFSFLGCLLYPNWRNMSGDTDRLAGDADGGAQKKAGRLSAPAASAAE